MTDATIEEELEPKKSGKAGLLVGLGLALAGAGGGYYATISGLIPLGNSHAEQAETKEPGSHGSEMSLATAPDIAFVDLPPIMISLTGGGDLRHLRFHAQLEVDSSATSDVEKITPRIIDVLNGYLRALELSDLRDPKSLARLRGQMLRRVSLVAGEGNVRDLLVMEFVLN
jgi:flagellar protein FliL